MSKYGVFSVPYFPVFGLNTETYSANLHIHSEYRKIRTRKNSVFGHFSRSAFSVLLSSFILQIIWNTIVSREINFTSHWYSIFLSNTVVQIAHLYLFYQKMQYIWLQTERQKGFPGSLLNLENKYWTKSKECQNYDKKTISREFNFFLFEKPSFSREFDFKSSQKSNFSREYNFGNSTQICEIRKVFFQKKLPSVYKPIKLLWTRYISHHPQV